MSTSRFCALRVNFVPMSIVSIVLEVYLGSLEVKFWSVEGVFGLWHSKLRPLDWILGCIRIELSPKGEVPQNTLRGIPFVSELSFT